MSTSSFQKKILVLREKSETNIKKIQITMFEMSLTYLMRKALKNIEMQTSDFNSFIKNTGIKFITRSIFPKKKSNCYRYM